MGLFKKKVVSVQLTKPKPKSDARMWLVIVIKHKIHPNAEDVELYRERYFKKPQAFKLKRSIEEGVSHNTARIQEIEIANIDEFMV